MNASSKYQIRQCERKECHFRFSVLANRSLGERCPRCGAATKALDAPYQDHEVKKKEPLSNGFSIETLLDNIRSVFNVGAIFRTADAVGIRYVHLCGITPTPDNPKLSKTALGAEKAVPWAHYTNGLAATELLREQGKRLWALEGGPRSESLFDVTFDLCDSPIVLIMGNEVSGVDPGILKQCERVFYLPMQGLKRSLNVAVAFGIAVYFLRYTYLISHGRTQSNVADESLSIRLSKLENVHSP